MEDGETPVFQRQNPTHHFEFGPGGTIDSSPPLQWRVMNEKMGVP